MKISRNEIFLPDSAGFVTGDEVLRLDPFVILFLNR